MKLLYIWIEEFRNIQNQGIVVDIELLNAINFPVEIDFFNILSWKT